MILTLYELSKICSDSFVPTWRVCPFLPSHIQERADPASENWDLVHHGIGTCLCQLLYNRPHGSARCYRAGTEAHGCWNEILWGCLIDSQVIGAVPWNDCQYKVLSQGPSVEGIVTLKRSPIYANHSIGEFKGTY